MNPEDETYTTARFCRECGHSLPVSAAFCGACGTQVKTPAATREDMPQIAPEIPETKPDKGEERDFGEILYQARQVEDAVTDEVLPAEPPPLPGVPATEMGAPYRTEGEVAVPTTERPLRTGELVLIEILSYVPILNIVLFVIWMFQPGHPGRARIAQAKLLVTVTVFAAVILILTVVLLMARYGVLDHVPSIRWESVD